MRRFTVPEVEKMAENQTPNVQPRHALSFPYKDTGMGGFEDAVILSLRTRKPVKSVLRKTRTHGTRLYRLFPGKYILYKVFRSNRGNIYGTVSIIRLDENGNVQTIKEWEIVRGQEQLLQLDDLPKEIQEILASNEEELPLFRAIFLLNQGEEGE